MSLKLKCHQNWNVTKHRKNCKKLPWELVGCQGVKVFLLKDVIITTSVTTVLYFCHYCTDQRTTRLLELLRAAKKIEEKKLWKRKKKIGYFFLAKQILWTNFGKFFFLVKIFCLWKMYLSYYCHYCRYWRGCVILCVERMHNFSHTLIIFLTPSFTRIFFVVERLRDFFLRQILWQKKFVKKKW